MPFKLAKYQDISSLAYLGAEPPSSMPLGVTAVGGVQEFVAFVAQGLFEEILVKLLD